MALTVDFSTILSKTFGSFDRAEFLPEMSYKKRKEFVEEYRTKWMKDAVFSFQYPMLSAIFRTDS